MFYINDLNEEQKAAVTCNAKRLLVNAGAGAGKSTVMAWYVGYRLYNRVDPHSIFCITFTRYAANEMRKKIKSLNLKTCGQVFINTFHKLAMYILSEYGDYDYEGIIDDNTKTDILKAISSKFKVSKEKLSEAIREYGIREVERKTDIALREYLIELKKNNLMDIDLLIPLTIKILSNEDIAKKVQEEIKYLIVDEFQDTNVLQNRMIELINPEYLCCVGDDYQSIYGWNNADIRYILDFQEKYDAEVINLKWNYRSTTQIVTAANNLISHNQSQLKKTVKARKEGNDIEIREFPDEKMQIMNIITTIAKHSEDEKTIAVLCRTNKEVSFIGNELRKYGIDFVTSKKKDLPVYIISRLQLISNLKNNLLAQQVFKFSPDVKIKALENNLSLFEAAEKFFPSEEISIYRELNEVSNKIDIEELFNQFQDKLHLFDVDVEKSIHEWAKGNKQAGEKAFLKDYLTFLAIKTSQDDLKNNAKVNVITVHSSKGLEYDIVITVNCNNFQWPKKNEDIEESRRLFYVAVTRAKELFIAMYSKKVKLPYTDKSVEAYPSTFLKELRKKA